MEQGDPGVPDRLKLEFPTCRPLTADRCGCWKRVDRRKRPPRGIGTTLLNPVDPVNPVEDRSLEPFSNRISKIDGIGDRRPVPPSPDTNLPRDDGSIHSLSVTSRVGVVGSRREALRVGRHRTNSSTPTICVNLSHLRETRADSPADHPDRRGFLTGSAPARSLARRGMKPVGDRPPIPHEASCSRLMVQPPPGRNAGRRSRRPVPRTRRRSCRVCSCSRSSRPADRSSARSGGAGSGRRSRTRRQTPPSASAQYSILLT